MPTPIHHNTPTTATFTTLTRLPDREPGEQQHDSPFSPQRLPDAPLEAFSEEALDEPTRRAAESDDDLMSHDINTSISDVRS